MLRNNDALPYAVKYKGRYYAAGEFIKVSDSEKNVVADVPGVDSVSVKRKPGRRKQEQAKAES